MSTTQLTEVITRYDNGAIKEIKYKDVENKLQGHYKRFYKNGEMCVSCSYVDGKRVGRCLEFEENGNKWKVCTYNQEGKVEGTYTEWWPNGSFRMKAECKNGEFVGEYTSWWDNGKVWEQRTYNQEGKKDGQFLEFDEDGKVIEEKVYKNGILVENNIQKESQSNVQKEVVEVENEPICITFSDGKTVNTTIKKFFTTIN